jgi:signal transduction histidine kinase
MKKPLRVLIVEDVEQDAILLVRELRRENFEVSYERVDTPEAMSAALSSKEWDIIFSDYDMPRFSALLALKLVRERKLDVPFIVVSGTVSEDTAVEVIRGGAHDFMAKGKFARLIPAVKRELREAQHRMERAQLEAQLLISDRMASVGTLAAGVAHEINNPLAALMANLDFAIRDLDVLRGSLRSESAENDWVAVRLGEIEEPLRDAKDCADRVRQIVRDLKIFSRSEEVERGAVDVRRVIESSIRMAWNELRHRARLVKEYGEVPPVEANEGRLGQVFLNLIVNAAQAIPEGSADKNEVRISTKLDAQGRVVVEVKDTGGGIPEEIMPRIFDPFFTTKPVGVGTGLGLAICRRIVTDLGGSIAVESQVGKGTTIRTALPAATISAEPARPSIPPAVAVRRSRILIVDDEAAVGRALERMLSTEHEVKVLAAARDAIEHIARGERFDLILCDLMMPQVTGMDLHDELTRIAPDQAERMVFMTGGAFTSRAREFLEQARNPRLEKPFDTATLRALVHSMLRKASPSA